MTSRGHFFSKCVSCQLFDFPFLVTQKCPRNVIQNVHEMSPKSVHEMSPNQVTFRGQKCPRNVTKNVHEMSPKKCPRDVTKKCPRNVTKKCPRNVTPYVHEMSPFMSTKCLPPLVLVFSTYFAYPKESMHLMIERYIYHIDSCSHSLNFTTNVALMNVCTIQANLIKT